TLTLRNANRVLWTLQVLLAALFLFAGMMKLILPLTSLEGPIALPGLFVRFIGVVEVLGALGLVLPGFFRVHPQLTALAACGLVGVMTGATVLSAMGMGLLTAIFPFAVGLAALYIVYGRGVALRVTTI
ncbi:MAG: putative integral rane protein, partial [Gemmatimonadetes bacterium]|nr:putative integral rane protein [Gemmatimonadota bacterium]